MSVAGVRGSYKAPVSLNINRKTSNYYYYYSATSTSNQHLKGKGKLSGLFCAILCATVVHSAMHTHINRPNSSLDWVLSQWAHFTVLRFIFVYVCKCMYFLYDCILHECVVIVTW